MVHHRYIKNIIFKIKMNNRVLVIDIRMGSTITRIISVYMPHVGYSWVGFVEIMDNISLLVSRAHHLGYSTIIRGDFNVCLDIGDRGSRMQDLLTEFNLVISNDASVLAGALEPS